MDKMVARHKSDEGAQHRIEARVRLYDETWKRLIADGIDPREAAALAFDTARWTTVIRIL